jgi:uncharacterized protein YbaA (DUF1428 family)
MGLVGLPDHLARITLAIFYVSLEFRVGNVLSGRMTEGQMTDFQRFFDAKDEAGALDWLERQVPDFRDTVNAELLKASRSVAGISEAIRLLLVD